VDAPAVTIGPVTVPPPTADLATFLAQDDGLPVVVFNLLRYAEGRRGLYEEYAHRIQPLLRDYGCETVYAGDCEEMVESHAEMSAWDSVVLVRYPSRMAFRELVSEPAYLEIRDLRSRGLAATVLQATSEWEQRAPSGVPERAAVQLMRYAGRRPEPPPSEGVIYGGDFSTPLTPPEGAGWHAVIVAASRPAGTGEPATARATLLTRTWPRESLTTAHPDPGDA
jgi:uncharacterized protein (DUF1330 family)